eukprot:jgi/Orpsp1_1/1185807/evm.model.c7180000095414.1
MPQHLLLMVLKMMFPEYLKMSFHLNLLLEREHFLVHIYHYNDHNLHIVK